MARFELNFEGKSAAIQFARFPAWFAFTIAVLGAVPLSHCVDDVIGVERRDVADSGWRLWRTMASTMGWDVPDSKSPHPHQVFNAIGVAVNLLAVPQNEAEFSLTDRRRRNLKNIMLHFLAVRRITPSEAGSLWGKLSHAATQMFGTYGRAQLAPFVWRQHEDRSNMNLQLEASLVWWLQHLDAYIPRVVQSCLRTRGVVVSYSDGEDAEAGVGVAVWHYHQSRPVAAFLHLPRQIRLLWSNARAQALPSEQLTDIFSIEAVGPRSSSTNFLT